MLEIPELWKQRKAHKIKISLKEKILIAGAGVGASKVKVTFH